MDVGQHTVGLYSS